MKLRYGLVLSSALTLAFTGCAASSGGGTGTTTAAPTTGGEVLAQGERPRDTNFTREAERALEAAEEAATAGEAATSYQAAAAAAEQAIAEDAMNPLGYRLAGEAYLGLEDYEKAGMNFDEAERLRPVYALETERIREMAWIDRYEAAAPMVNSGQYEMAIEYFEQANAIYQGRPEVLVTLGQVYAQLQEHDLAIERLQSAQAIIESDRIDEMDEETAANWRDQGAMIPTMIAQSLVNAERFEEAVAALQELLAAEPGNTSYMRTLGTTYVRMGQPEQAQTIFDQMLASGGMDSVEFYSVGVGFYQMEEYAAAAGAFRGGAEASVNDRDAIEMWARSLQIAYPTGEGAVEPPEGALEELMTAGQRWLELDPNNQNAHLIMAQTANRTGNADMAREMIGAIEEWVRSKSNEVFLAAQVAYVRALPGGNLNGNLPGTWEPHGRGILRITLQKCYTPL